MSTPAQAAAPEKPSPTQLFNHSNGVEAAWSTLPQFLGESRFKAIPSQWSWRTMGLPEETTDEPPEGWEDFTLEEKATYAMKENGSFSETKIAAYVQNMKERIINGHLLRETNAGQILKKFIDTVGEKSKASFEEDVRALAKMYPTKIRRSSSVVEITLPPVEIDFQGTPLVFGPFSTRIPLLRGELREIQFGATSDTPIYKTNPTVNPHTQTIHPHIAKAEFDRGAYSHLCFGEEDGTAIRAAREGDLFSLVESICQVLYTYNPDSPYTRPEDFKKTSRQSDPKKCPICKTTRSITGGQQIRTCLCIRNLQDSFLPREVHEQWSSLTFPPEKIDGKRPPRPQDLFDNHHKMVSMELGGKEIAFRTSTFTGYYIDKGQIEAAKESLGEYIEHRLDNAPDDHRFVSDLGAELQMPEEKRLILDYEYSDNYGFRANYILGDSELPFFENDEYIDLDDDELDEAYREHRYKERQMANEAKRFICEYLEDCGIEIHLQEGIPSVSDPTTGRAITAEEFYKAIGEPPPKKRVSKDEPEEGDETEPVLEPIAEPLPEPFTEVLVPEERPF